MANGLALAVLPLGIALTIVNVVLVGLVYSRLLPPDFLRISASAFVTAEGSLVAIWIAFSSRPLPIRLIFAIPGVAVAFLPCLVMSDRAALFPFGVRSVLRDSAITGGAIVFVFDILLVLGVSVPLLAVRIAGWRLIKLVKGADPINAHSSQNPKQFTLRQMFGWTLAAAMVAGLARLVVRPDYYRFGVVTILLVEARSCLACSAVALSVMWAALGRGRPSRRLLIVAAGTGLLTFLGLSLQKYGVLAIFEIVSSAVFDALLIYCGLLLFRRIGYRLIRSQRTFSALTNCDIVR